MTAVASPPSLQPLQRIGWDGREGHDEAAPVSTDNVPRVLIPRKILQRPNSSSSASSESSTGTTISTVNSTETAATEASSISFAGVGRGGRAPASGFEKESWPGSRKAKAVWNISRTEGAFTTGTVGPGRTLNLPSANGIPSTAHHTGPLSSAPENMQNVQQGGGGRVLPHANGNEPQALLILVPTNATFERKSISVPLYPEILRIGRQTNAKTIPTATNGYFDSKVLSRQHAEVWADRNGKIWIRDVKSSNGTFVNGQRLSPESRDSEPHELRENDSLELGIDIVSEDQKSIVHHKVSAKVEHAGFPNSSANVMDLTFGDLDPGASSGLLTAMPNGIGVRPRLGSQGSVSSTSSRMDAQSAIRASGALGVQRHMNSFLSPISIEAVMRKLNTELRQARQQSQDLHRTKEYFDNLLASDSGKEPPKPPASILPPKTSSGPILGAQPLSNGLLSTSKLDQRSPFSAPPAPPPQLPLPEKPDGPRSAHVEGAHSLPFKRASVDSGLTNGKSESSSQIISLVATLQSTKQELDKQGSRVKELEELLKHERKAREMAEERARLLSNRQQTIPEKEALTPFTPPEEDSSVHPMINGTKDDDREFSDTTSETGTVIDGTTFTSLRPRDKNSDPDLTNTASSIASLQEKLNKMVSEMEEVRKQLEQQRNRAEAAETERDTLVEMVQRIRDSDALAKPSPKKVKAGKEASGSADPNGNAPSSLLHRIAGKTAKDGSKDGEESPHADTGTIVMGPASTAANGKPPGSSTTDPDKDRQIRELQEALAAAVARARSDEGNGLSQAAPYVSVFSVVLLGVSAMMYLNSLQKSET